MIPLILADNGTQEQCGDIENFFILFHQLRDTTLLKLFIEGSDQNTHDLLGTVELQNTVELKTTKLASMQQQLNKLKEKLCHIPEEELLWKGKEKLTWNTMLKLQRKAEDYVFLYTEDV